MQKTLKILKRIAVFCVAFFLVELALLPVVVGIAGVSILGPPGWLVFAYDSIWIVNLTLSITLFFSLVFRLLLELRGSKKEAGKKTHGKNGAEFQDASLSD